MKGNGYTKGYLKVVGIFGYPIGHTLSPKMHNAAFAHLGLDYVYLPFEVKPERLGSAIEGLSGLNMVGVNITVPHKERVVEYLDELSDEARHLGAVNTIKLDGERLIGYNTDGEGFIKSLKLEGGCASPKGKNILLLGAGGVAKAVAISLASHGAARITIANRTLERAEELANRLEKIAPQVKATCIPLGGCELDKYTKDSQIVINATSIGLKSDAMPPVNTGLFHDGQLVYDVIYNPPKTKLLAEAELRGAKILSGLGMLIYQGALAFEIWTGEKAPVEVMRRAIVDKCQSSNDK